MKTIGCIFGLLLCLAITSVYSQTWEEYQKQEQANYNKFVREQNDYLNKLRKEYDNYVKQQDKDFAAYLLKEWENYAVFSGKKAPEKPKPKQVPEYKTPEKPRENWNKIPAKSPTFIAQPKVNLVILPLLPFRKPAMEGKEGGAATFDFFGMKAFVEFDPAFQVEASREANKQVIGNFWSKASQSNYTPVVEQLLEIKNSLNLNDYGYLVLVQKFANYLYLDNANAANLMIWFILVRSGYGARIAYQGNSILLLIPSMEQIYQMSYLELEGVNYYVLPGTDRGNLYTYDKDYNAACKPFDFNITSPINFGGKKVTKDIKFNFEDKEYTVQMAYDPDLVNFYKDYPLLELDVYFNAAVSLQAKESLAESIKPLISGMEESKAVNFLLHFVQTAFAYKTDPQQFGKEKFFFAEEVFYYPFCDCEDRSVLFSYLVRELLGLKVIGLEYPAHMSTAVHFTTDQPGDYVLYNGEKYVMADPTYINAPFGMTMPVYKDVVPTIMPINNMQIADIVKNKNWQIAEKNGCFKGSNRKNSKLLENGQYLLTGFFTKAAQFGDCSLTGADNGNSCFIVKMNSSGQTLWANSVVSSDNAVGMSVETTKNGNILVAGVFTGNIKFTEKSISTPQGNADLFIACFSPEGTPKWISKAGLDSLPAEVSVSFSAIFNSDGIKKNLKKSNQEMPDYQIGLSVDDAGNIYYSGITNNALAVAGNIKPAAFAGEVAVNIPELLKTENDNFIAHQTERSISGLFAAVRLVKYMGVELSGKLAQQTLDKYNPGFKKGCPTIYKNLGRISFLKNAKGIITISTENGQDILFDKVKITNKSCIAIAELSGGDYKIEILSGIKVGKMVVWYNLNFVKLLRKNGDMLFDYDTDHSQTTVNMRKDILN